VAARETKTQGLLFLKKKKQKDFHSLANGNAPALQSENRGALNE
jgi:hypothetical protein